jgi:mevalonate kinase
LKSKNPLYYAKILLFGEYGIIENSMGLSIPFHDFKAEFISSHEPLSSEEIRSNESLRKYCVYLKIQQAQGKLPCSMDLASFEKDIEGQIYFCSTIPQGFGVGSSGALVAAVYAKYAKNPILASEASNGENFIILKKTLGQLENFFHGTSSGLDPLICYLDLPVLIKDKEELGAVSMPKQHSIGEGAIFLINSGNPGHTQSMVAIFLQKLKNRGFRKLFKTELKELNDACIQDFLKGDMKGLFDNLKGLSSFFFDYFKQMIPSKFEQIWKEGIDTNKYYLKLCGSGGGGYILGFTKDIKVAQEHLKDHQLNIIHRF